MNPQHEQSGNSFFDMVRTSQGVGASTEQNKIEISADVLSQQESNQTDKNVEQDKNEQSTMPHEARRILVYIMRHGTILATENLKLFDQLCRYEPAIRQHLADVYIQLVLDVKQGVAYIVNAETVIDVNDDAHQEIDDFPTLIRKRTLTLYDTLVLLIIRKFYQEREAAGEQKIIIDVEYIQANLIPFVPLTNHDNKDRKKLSGTLDKFSEKKILSSVRNEEGRYEITPIIRYVVNAELLQSLLTEYEQLANKV